MSEVEELRQQLEQAKAQMAEVEPVAEYEHYPAYGNRLVYPMGAFDKLPVGSGFLYPQPPASPGNGWVRCSPELQSEILDAFENGDSADHYNVLRDFVYSSELNAQPAEARVAELTEALEGIRYCHPHDEGRYIDKACEVLDKNFSGQAWLLRKQAEAVEHTLAFYEFGMEAEDMTAALREEVQRLRQQADEAERGES